MTEWLKNFVNVYLTQFAINLFFAIVILVVGFTLTKVAIKAISKLKVFDKIDNNARIFITNFVGVALRVIVIITAVIVIGVPEASVIAVLGSCGLAIGLALQGGLTNIASGIVIMLTKPFHAGDYVESGSVSGVVKDIGIYYTKLTTPDNKDVSVPNSAIANATIVNYSIESTRRIDFDFNIAYGTDIDLVRKVLVATATMNDLVSKDPAPEVYVAGHGESSITMKLRVWCAANDYWTVYFDMWEDVKKAFGKFEIEVPYNRLNVTIENH